MVLCMRAHFMLWEPFIVPIHKAMSILLLRPIQGYGNTASLIYSDTWVGKPDCLHLSYTFETAWMELTSIMLSEIPYDLTYKWNLITKTNKQVKYKQRY